MPIVTPGSGDVPELEDGLYTFKIIKTRMDVRQDDTFGNKGDPVLELHCAVQDVLDEEGKEIVLRPVVNLKYSPGGKRQPSTLYLFAKATGVAPADGQAFDTDLLEGRMFQGLTHQEEGKWPKIESKSLIPLKGQKAPTAAQQGRQPPEGAAVDADTAHEWFTKMFAQGFQRKAIIDLCAEMFEKRVPGELNAAELKGLEDELLSQA